METQNFPDNTLYEMDNLIVLRGMNSETVDLIATDPPFNTKRSRSGTAGFYVDNWKYGDTNILPDQWKWNEVHPKWLEEIEDNHKALHSVIKAAEVVQDKNTAAFLCFLSVRLLEMHRILKSTGSIYLHCDPTASHYIKACMDAIFGKQNFQNEIVWRRATAHNDPQKYGNNTDRLLYYSKRCTKRVWNGDAIIAPKSPEEIDKAYPLTDGRGKYRSGDLTGPSHGYSGGESSQPWSGYDVRAKGRVWSVPLTGKYAKWIEDNLIPNYRLGLTQFLKKCYTLRL
ncbi:site-specific DNA-methyltransferase [Candidatus Poribacteria bacterium]|nr:site-specific DNA-methyltransferase [Candidatus Poribacteria bacterium]MYG08327.1 site-specific DNA-methyltransferase [Candidatus Poribacteria bacterium]MYK20832.1 site-specific DNA-methyltransferase [Candidatus Poribacteria bacterium]